MGNKNINKENNSKKQVKKEVEEVVISTEEVQPEISTEELNSQISAIENTPMETKIYSTEEIIVDYLQAALNEIEKIENNFKGQIIANIKDAIDKIK